VKPKLIACVVSERVRLKDSIAGICFYPMLRYKISFYLACGPRYFSAFSYIRNAHVGSSMDV